MSAAKEPAPATWRLRIFVAGGTGYIGRAVVEELVGRGHEVVCMARPRAGVGGGHGEAETRRRLPGAEVRFGEVSTLESVQRDGVRGERFDAVVSCLGTRGGGAGDSWLVEDHANTNVLVALAQAGASHFVLLSAICVQKPRLAFQRAKLAFEQRLIDSGMTYSIVRPTAYFKSLAGQVEAVRRGRPFVVFGDGQLTACKPLGEADLACYLADCLTEPSRRNAILPIGGPGPAITPRQQGALLAELCGRPVRYRHVPVALLDVIIAVLTVLGWLVSSLRDKAELARIGRYYGTESMLVWDEARGRYDAEATPEYGSDTLRDFYARVLAEGMAGQELGAHAVFDRPRREPGDGRG